MGIANQLLATIALAVGTTYLLQHAPRRAYALCTGIPLVFVVATVFTAGIESIQSWWRELATLAARLAGSLLFAARIDSGGHHAGAVGPGGSRFRAALGRAASLAAAPGRGSGRKSGMTRDSFVDRVSFLPMPRKSAERAAARGLFLPPGDLQSPGSGPFFGENG